MQELYVSNWEFRRVQAEIDEMKHKVSHSELRGPWGDPQGRGRQGVLIPL